MRVGVIPADRGGCGMYRLVWPALALQALELPGLEVDVDEDGSVADQVKIVWEKAWGDEPREFTQPIALLEPPPYDVLVFQRPLHCKYARVFRLLREAGVTVIVDVDDNFDRIDPANIAWHSAQEGWMRDEEIRDYAKEYGRVEIDRKTNTGWFHTSEHAGSSNRRHWANALRAASAVTCSTQELRQHITARWNPWVHLLDNYVPESHIQPHTSSTPPVVGWTGSIQTHPRDLDEIGAGLARARQRLDMRFKVVGTGVGVGEALRTQVDETTGWVAIEDYPREYATLDVALCPLADSAFNRAKSRLKGLEAAAVGAVPIMSPLPEYRKLYHAGVGQLAARPREWQSWITRFVDEDSLRDERRERGYDYVREQTVERNAWRWAEAWVTAVERERGVSHTR